MTQQNTQQFGGNWTEEKLNIFTEYLTAYLTALQNQNFGKVYIDAFAGTGEIVTNDGEQHLVGSAKRALSSDLKFDRYYFIEENKKKVAELQRMVDAEYPHLANHVTIYCGDANARLSEIINQVDWRFNRGLLFLDPCATEVNWTTLTMIARTKSIDMWYLFPFSALNRMLTKDGNMDPTWAACIDRLLGDSGWRIEFYKKDPQISLFDFELGSGESDRLIKDANPERIKEYIIGRLQSTFPCVSKHPRIFKNKNNSPLFLFCFAISNDSEKAQGLALKIANQYLSPKRTKDGDILKTITRKTMLYKTGVEYGDYTMNHVLGCAHGCKYPCYAFLQKKRFGQVATYDEWLEPYLVSNTLEILDREIPRLKSKIKSVQLCFTTDPFMYGYDDIKQMTLAAIKKLNDAGIKCTVLTKGLLPTELAEYSKDNEYGITLVSLDEGYRERIEPGAAPYVQRLASLRVLHESGFKTWVSIEPYPTPNIITQDINKILEAVSFTDKLIFGRTNYSKEISAYALHRAFYNEQAEKVINFCKKNHIQFHIKDGTISK